MSRGITQFANAEAVPCIIGLMCAHALVHLIPKTKIITTKFEFDVLVEKMFYLYVKIFLTYLFPWGDGDFGQNNDDERSLNSIKNLQIKLSK